MLACVPRIVVGISVLSLRLIADAKPLRLITDELHPEENTNFFEGDIIIPMHLIEYNKDRNLIMDRKYLWPNKTLVYELSDEYQTTEKMWIEHALQSLQNETCVRFKRKTFENDFVYVRNKFGCAAVVGFHPGRVDLFLSLPGCIKWGTIQHEFLHSLGFWHEHTRYDRDKYISIQWENIMKGLEVNFAIRGPDESQFEGLPYDFDSVMHYRAFAFSRNASLPTIIPRKENTNIGQREKFSRSDLAKLNRLYDCGSEYYQGDNLVSETTTQSESVTETTYEEIDITSQVIEETVTGFSSSTSSPKEKITASSINAIEEMGKLKTSNTMLKENKNHKVLNKLQRKKRNNYIPPQYNPMNIRQYQNRDIDNNNMRPPLPLRPSNPHYWNNPQNPPITPQEPEHHYIITCSCQDQNQYEHRELKIICHEPQQTSNRKNSQNSNNRPQYDNKEHRYNERPRITHSSMNYTAAEETQANDDFESNTSNKTSGESYDYYNFDVTAITTNNTQYGSAANHKNKQNGNNNTRTPRL